ncbi:MAG: lipoprotein [Erysipelotrichaceae bacterium]|nr:lipoprotein [Erysipelotrichaceae bacterium]
MKKLLLTLTLALVVTGCSNKPVKEETQPTQVETTTLLETTNMETTETTTPAETMEFADLASYSLVKTQSNVKPLSLVELTGKLGTDQDTYWVFLGYAGCPWCQKAMPVYNEFAGSEEGTFYYVDVSQPITDEEYAAFVEKTRPFLKDGDLYVPLVLGVKNGTITGGHLALVPSFNINAQEEVNEEQKTELINIYKNLIK